MQHGLIQLFGNTLFDDMTDAFDAAKSYRHHDYDVVPIMVGPGRFGLYLANAHSNDELETREIGAWSS